jgi:hypothetical protein
VFGYKEKLFNNFLKRQDSRDFSIDPHSCKFKYFLVKMDIRKYTLLAELKPGYALFIQSGPSFALSNVSKDNLGNCSKKCNLL